MYMMFCFGGYCVVARIALLVIRCCAAQPQEKHHDEDTALAVPTTLDAVAPATEVSAQKEREGNMKHGPGWNNYQLFQRELEGAVGVFPLQEQERLYRTWLTYREDLTGLERKEARHE